MSTVVTPTPVKERNKLQKLIQLHCPQEMALLLQSHFNGKLFAKKNKGSWGVMFEY